MEKFRNFFNSRLKNIFYAGTLVALLYISIILPIDKYEAIQTTASDVEPEEEVIRNTTPYVNPFEGIDLVGKSAIVWDIKNQRALFEKKADEVLPLASITKMLTAVLAYDILPPETEIVINKDFLQAEGDTGILADERWTFKDLLEFSLLSSSNDGARAVASVAGSVYSGAQTYEEGREEFIKKINVRIKELGLKQTHVEDETGLDKNEFESGAYGTARDIARLFQYIYKNRPEILEPTSKSEIEFTSLSGESHLASNTNVAVGEIAGIVGSKTGYTELAGGNLAVIFDSGLGDPFVAVVLGSTFDGRFSDIKKLAQATKNHIIQIKEGRENNNLTVIAN